MAELTPLQYAAILADPLNPSVWLVNDVTPAQYAGIIAAIQAAGMAIGGAVTGGTAGRVLYVDTGPILANSSGLTFSTSNGLKVTVGSLVATFGKSTNAGQFQDGTHNVTLADGTNNVLYAAGDP